MNKKKILIWVSILFAQFFLFYWASSQPVILDFHARFFAWQKDFHITLFSIFPFSVGDIFYVILIGIIICFLIKIKTFNIEILLLVNIFYFLYQIFWGLLYFQSPIKNRFQQTDFTAKDVEDLTWKYLHLCKTSREKVSEDENGVFKINDLQQVEEAILQSQKSLPSYFKEETARIPSKKSLFSPVMNFTGIAGYYNPFTAEAQYNSYLPATHLPFTIAHENAHQQGFAREQEANFIGFLLGTSTNNEDLKYSANWFALKSLLRFHREQNPDFVQKIIAEFSSGMQRDYANERMFYEKYNGWTSHLFSFLNDIFLKSNQQEGRITYDYFIDLLILHEKNS